MEAKLKEIAEKTQKRKGDPNDYIETLKFIIGKVSDINKKTECKL